MHIQPVMYRVKIYRLLSFLHPLDNASYMIASKSHAHKFLDQIIVEMATNKL